MAAFVSLATGDWSAYLTTWLQDGGTATREPATGDKVTVSAGHTVTVDGVKTCGDDTSTALNISGTLKWSRGVTSALTVRGQIVPGSGGTVDMGTEADPIPAAYTATLTYNDSASMAAMKYGVSLNAAVAGFRAWGATKTRYQFMSAVTSSTVFDAADATGWAVGDILVLGPTAPGNATTEARAISSITSLGGTAAQITLGGAVTNANWVGRIVVNVTRNVRILPQTPQTYGAQLLLTTTSASSDNVIEVGWCEVLASIGSASGTLAAGFRLNINKSAHIKNSDGVSVHDVVSVSGTSVTTTSSAISASSAYLFSTDTNQGTVRNPSMCSIRHMRGGGPSGGSGGFSAPVVVGTEHALAQAPATGTAGIFTITDPVIRGVGAITGGTFLGQVSISGGSADGFTQLGNTALGVGAVGTLVLGMDLDGPLGVTTLDLFTGLSSSGTGTKLTLDNCQIPADAYYSRTNSLRDASPLFASWLKSRNGDVTQQEKWTPGGLATRENATFKRGASSMRFDNWFSAVGQTHTIKFNLPAGETALIIGSMRYNSTYGTTYPPSVSMSGAGLTTQTATCPTSGADTWHDYSLSITNTNAATTEVTVTYAGRSAANSTDAFCWFDGVVDSPWVESARHFGYEFLPQTALVADDTITVSETTAMSYPVQVIHGSAGYGAILITGNVTARQVYEHLVADLCQTDNQGVAVHYTAISGGDGFETTYTVIIEGATVTGGFQSQSHVILSYGGDVDGVYTELLGSSGETTHVKIKAPNLISGSRVQVYDVATATEMYNGVLSGAGLTLPAVYAGDKTIRLRAEHSTKLPLETTGLLSSAGLSFLDEQEDDTVYTGNAIDGSTVTEFSADGPNIQVDINDPDGTTSVQRLYAWLQYYQTTAEGIASVFFGAMVAQDSLNYAIDQSLVDLKLDNVAATPVIIVGGYLFRRDGSTVIAATSGSIQMDPGRAYLPSTATLSADLWAYSSRTLTDGAAANVAAIKAKTDNLPAAPAAVDDIPTPAENADALLARSIAGGADGGRTVRDALRPNRNKTSLAGGTLTVYQEDDTTPAWTADVTTGSRDPVTGVDPA